MSQTAPTDDEREAKLREAFTDVEIQTGFIAIAGLERLYASLEARGGPYDDRLVAAIQLVKGMFQGGARAPAGDPAVCAACGMRAPDHTAELEKKGQ